MCLFEEIMIKLPKHGKDMSDKPKEPSFKGTQPGSMLRLSLGSEERQVFEMATGKGGGGILLFKQMET